MNHPAVVTLEEFEKWIEKLKKLYPKTENAGHLLK